MRSSMQIGLSQAAGLWCWENYTKVQLKDLIPQRTSGLFRETGKRTKAP